MLLYDVVLIALLISMILRIYTKLSFTLVDSVLPKSHSICLKSSLILITVSANCLS